MVAANVVSGLPADPVAASAYSHIRNVAVFPNGTWVENIAVRWNGHLLVTLLNRPEVWEVEPLSGHSELVYSFPEATGTLGIAEIEHDIFAVNVGNSTLPATGVPELGAYGPSTTMPVDQQRLQAVSRKRPQRRKWLQFHLPSS